MILVHTHLVGAKTADLAQGTSPYFWPPKPNSNHKQYFIFSNPFLTAAEKGRFVDAFAGALGRVGADGNAEGLGLAEQVLQALPDSQAHLMSEGGAWALASFVDSGVLLGRGGKGQIHHLVGGVQWQPVASAGGHPIFLLRADELTADDYLLLSSEPISADLLEQATPLLNRNTRLGPFQRADRLSQLLQIQAPGLTAYLIGILSTRAPQPAPAKKREDRSAHPQKTKTETTTGWKLTRRTTVGVLVAAALALTGYTLQGAWRHLSPQERHRNTLPVVSKPRQLVKPAHAVALPEKRAEKDEPQTVARVEGQKKDSTRTVLVPKKPLRDSTASPQQFARVMRMQGRAFYDKSSFVEAFNCYRQAAEKGDKYAQFYLGLMYARGLGTPKDSAMAFSWIHQAAVQNLPPAREMLDQLKRM